MKKTIHRYIVVLLCMLFLLMLPACTNTKDLNPTVSELLKVAATELGLNERAETPDHIIVITYDIAAFAGMLRKQYRRG